MIVPMGAADITDLPQVAGSANGRLGDEGLRICFASRYEAETQWTKPQNGAQMTPCSGATR
jgi:hypothetical protein